MSKHPFNNCSNCNDPIPGELIKTNEKFECIICGKKAYSTRESNPIPKHLPKGINRPRTLTGSTTRIKTGLGNLYITINLLDNKPFEVFAIIGKSGKSIQAKAEAIGRLVSLNLRNEVGVEKIIDQLKDIAGDSSTFDEGKPVKSIPDAIAKILGELDVKKDT